MGSSDPFSSHARASCAWIEVDGGVIKSRQEEAGVQMRNREAVLVRRGAVHLEYLELSNDAQQPHQLIDTVA